jgi:hypothetical protein
MERATSYVGDTVLENPARVGVVGVGLSVVALRPALRSAARLRGYRGGG